MGYNDWRPYVSVAERQENAKRTAKKLQKKGKQILPVEIEGRTIARSFWGKGWCTHIESFSDYANRLPRGTRYVRNGSVFHLAIEQGRIEAMVSGSEIYDVSITIDKLPNRSWNQIKKKCAGEITSLLELLQGTLSDNVMKVVSNSKSGLFPKPKEISFQCSCPDWADMCKHVAAVMYGVGHRLDSRPELLFLLRDVNPEELIELELEVPEFKTTNEFDGEDLGDLFGIELDLTDLDEPKPTQTASKKQKTRKNKKIFAPGKSIRVKEGVYISDETSIDMSKWRGRVLEVYEEDDETLIEVEWDSITLQNIPVSFIKETLQENLDWARMIVPQEDLVFSRSRDSREDVERTVSEIESQIHGK